MKKRFTILFWGIGLSFLIAFSSCKAKTCAAYSSGDSMKKRQGLFKKTQSGMDPKIYRGW